MCGFIASYNKDRKFDKSEISKLRKILDHRGPDYNDYIITNNLLLLHNRLSIIDLNKESNQPFVDQVTGNIIIFNGEIYNYKELKKEYNNIEWNTNSDTEVILKLYQKLGLNFINKLNGIFAFCIYDKKENAFYVFRDRFGIKPVYYYFKNNKFSFSSEIKGLLAINKNIELEASTLFNYIQNGLNVYSNKTFFKNIYSLNPGSFIKIKLNKISIQEKKYWDLDNFFNKSNDEYNHENIENLITDSFRLNMTSDVEVALSLSSGLDSILMYSEIKKLGYENIKSFTFGFNEKKYDEVGFLNNQGLNITNHYKYYFKSKNLLSELKKSISYYETPLGGLGSLCAFYLMRMVKKENIKVILTGEGSDEIFGGYKYYFPAFFADINNKFMIEKQLALYNKQNYSNFIPNSRTFKKWIEDLNFSKVLAPDSTHMSSDYLKRNFIENNQLSSHKIKKFNGKGKLNRVIYEDIVSKKLPKLLHFQDRASSSSGVESRVPYLDHRLAEIMLGSKNNLKINNGKNKYIIRNLLQNKYKLNINSNNKLYVSSPQREWIKKDCKNEIIQTLKNGYLEKTNFFKMNKFYDDYEKYCNNEKLGNSFFVWKLLNLEFLFSSFKL